MIDDDGEANKNFPNDFQAPSGGKRDAKMMTDDATPFKKRKGCIKVQCMDGMDYCSPTECDMNIHTTARTLPDG